MQAVYTETLIKTDLPSEFLSRLPIFKVVSCYIGSLKINPVFFEGKRIIFGDITKGKVVITYITSSSINGKCLTFEQLKKEYYKIKFNTDSMECIDYGDIGIESYMQEAINRLQIQSSNKRFIKQYSLNVGSTTMTCGTTVDEYIPRYGMLRTDKGMYARYNIVKGAVKPILDTITQIDKYTIGYELPDAGKIVSITADGRPISFQQFSGYFFFPVENTTISVNYYSDLTICESGCIEFEEVFWRIPVLYALYKIGINTTDDRRFEWEKDYNDLVEDYKKYLLFKTRDRKEFQSDFTLGYKYRPHRSTGFSYPGYATYCDNTNCK